ncbi:acyl-CoA/acyl-ACP dehydrogenase [Caldimonas thermodepolymerans]|uniref:Acyl-CoA dehydrogenase n=1 Tax=Caldimonas thermodepolymerans TaxID=215580 RepID=A0A2S5T853_9BURK|nr:acyl-CoA dehydrogenase family protein [Caldimonas thermodepolymerans]PPE71102.1 acyl-CoA dehydrogenase [Caldimonas thermodepolymerans]QPC31405.1 acyl-CoA/acyl-ACP dehydrogenase [Caldimonas thermodepolymerans]RDH99626.1 alkylation response protein AidB-like acyl-CoA dehydrogenase [Caldimonas thermodepolymerans]TCP07648.1 alkylation response protein AidB-like acyl-CoA dehydrogenase [Caldimonas thermodepolymerans]UZG47818.1 acyl-CoA/acyl-ACP dehydrogenase [Caldimonas thermodepolymerans]
MSQADVAPSQLAQTELVHRAQQLAQDFAALAERHDASGEAPAPQFEALRRAGLLTLTVPQALGGWGLGLEAAQAVVGAIAQGDPSVALILSMQLGQHAAIARSLARGEHGDWPRALAERVAREAVQGRGLINSAQVEPELGSPSNGGLPKTVARRAGGQWRLSGHKLYVTGVPLLDYILVLAVTDEDEPRLGSFLVPRDAPGVRVVPTWNQLGMRATASHDVVLEDVAVPLEHAVGLHPARLGLQRDVQGNAWYFLLVATVYDGAARAARDWLLGFLQERRPAALGGANLASLPTVQEAVGQIEVALAANALLLRAHARACDQSLAGGEPVDPQLAGVVKHTVIDNAVQATRLALELAGNHGLARRNPLERHLRNVLCGHIHAPSNSLLRALAGRRALERAAADAPTAARAA